MNDKLLFSIVIPVYNNEKYLSQCLDSVLHQTYTGEYEVVIINDGSKDNSIKIIRKYQKMFQKCIVIDRENKGVLYTRVEGARTVTAEYMLFLDSDDFLPNNTLEIYESYLKKYNYDIIRGNYAIVDGELNKIVEDYKFEDEIEKNELLQKFYSVLLTDTIFNSVWRQLIKRTIISFDDINLEIAMGDDIEFNLACYKNAQKIKIINDNVYTYRTNEKSLSHTYSDERLIKNITDLSLIYDTIIKDLEKYNDTTLIKLGYSSFLKRINYYIYMLINNSKNDEKINEIVDKIIYDEKTSNARKTLKYKDIPFRKNRLLLYILMNRKRKIYIILLKILSKIGIKYNH